MAAAMDADGFTVVRRKSGAPGAHGGGGGDVLESANVRRKKKRGGLLAPDFYAFQRAGDRAADLAALRAGFAEDRARIAALRGRTPAASFKPF